MASDGAAATPAKVTPKKANLLDPHSIKHLLDETISEVLLAMHAKPYPILPLEIYVPLPLCFPHLIRSVPRFVQVVKSKGYAEDNRLGNWKLLIGTAVIGVALLAQFYPKKFPQNREFLLGCIALYPLM
jgi:signal peptidase complex subunit 2